MDKEDGRKLTRQAQHERRKQAARLHRRGMSIKQIADTLRTKDKLRTATEAHMNMLKNNPQRVRSYFEDPNPSLTPPPPKKPISQPQKINNPLIYKDSQFTNRFVVP